MVLNTNQAINQSYFFICTLELWWLELEGTGKMYSSYQQFEQPKFSHYRKKIGIWSGKVTDILDSGLKGVKKPDIII
jgi:hypothetical protein